MNFPVIRIKLWLAETADHADVSSPKFRREKFTEAEGLFGTGWHPQVKNRDEFETLLVRIAEDRARQRKTPLLSAALDVERDDLRLFLDTAELALSMRPERASEQRELAHTVQALYHALVEGRNQQAYERMLEELLTMLSQLGAETKVLETEYERLYGSKD